MVELRLDNPRAALAAVAELDTDTVGRDAGGHELHYCFVLAAAHYALGNAAAAAEAHAEAASLAETWPDHWAARSILAELDTARAAARR